MNHHHKYFSSENTAWRLDIVDNFWVGGKLLIPNLSGGYHGILTQWWSFYKNTETPCNVLLISEGVNAKKEFESIYPLWTFKTIDHYPELTAKTEEIEIDYKADICSRKEMSDISERFDLIINQATLEHVYNPFGAMENLTTLLNDDGIIVTHTHPPAFPYHGFPHDYFRFMIDWWQVIPEHIDGIELKELIMFANSHVFSCYQKCEVTD